MKEGKGGPLVCNLTSSQGLDLAAGGAAAVSVRNNCSADGKTELAPLAQYVLLFQVRGFSADGKWLLARSGEQAMRI